MTAAWAQVAAPEGYAALGGYPDPGPGAAAAAGAPNVGVGVVLSVCVFCLTVSLVPIYNKRVLSGGAEAEGFPYPVATAFLQLGFVSLALGLCDSLAFLLCPWRATWSRSWLFGPQLWYKLRHAGPAGLCFGLKFATTNWGLQLVPTATHVLLQSTDLLWTVACARIVAGERVGAQEGLAVLLSTLGTGLVSLDATKALSAPLVPLLVNALTPLPLALSVATLRRGVKELMRPDSPSGGMLAVEVTAIKLAISSLTCLAVACVVEGGATSGLCERGGQAEGYYCRDPWWVVLAERPARSVALLLVGAMLILVFQVNITWLTRLTSAVTVGMLASVKVVPQWSLNSLMGLQGPTSAPFTAGVVLVLLSSLLYLEVKAAPCERAYRRCTAYSAACGKPAPWTGSRALLLS